VEEVSIGEFARRSRLSLKALRLYDELGVLVPSRVDKRPAIATTTSVRSMRHA
jgi:MerR HTH family regulatory protein